MKLLDANVLLYAYNSDSPHHKVCRIWLEQAFNSTEPIALPWPPWHSFALPRTHAYRADR